MRIRALYASRGCRRKWRDAAGRVGLELGHASHFAWAEERLAGLRGNPGIPEQPDREWIDDWLHRSYLNFWSRIQ